MKLHLVTYGITSTVGNCACSLHSQAGVCRSDWLYTGSAAAQVTSSAQAQFAVAEVGCAADRWCRAQLRVESVMKH